MKKTIQGNKLLNIITEIYILFIIIVFPLCVDKTGFFRILECKWHTYVITTLIYIFLCASIIIYSIFINKEKLLKDIKLNIIHYLALLYLLITCLSYIFSPFKNDYDLIIGVGRGEGLLVSSLYVISFLLISLFGKFKKRYLLYFSISSICIGSVGFLQYIGFNPFNLYQLNIGTHNVSFFSTIGNIDFLSAIYCLFLPISCGCLLFQKDLNKKERMIHTLSIILTFFSLIIIGVDSGKVAIMGITFLMFPLIVFDSYKFKEFIKIIAYFLIACALCYFLNVEYHYDIKRIVLNYRIDILLILYILVISLLFILSKLLEKYKYNCESKKNYKIAYILETIIVLAVPIILYIVPINSGIIGEVHQMLHGNFDDKFGTYRVFLWKRTFNILPEYPLLGSGPDSFAIRFMNKYTKDIAAIGPLTLNDTAANVYLTMSINIGIIGLISYLSFIASIIIKKIKKNNNITTILLITLLCFLIQDFFNLWTVIVIPIFWCMLGILSQKAIEK